MAAVFVLVAASFIFFFILPDPAAASFDQSRDISSLPYLGKFEFGQHDVKGHVYQVHTSTTHECMHIHTNEPAFLTTLPD